MLHLNSESIKNQNESENNFVARATVSGDQHKIIYHGFTDLKLSPETTVMVIEGVCRSQLASINKNYSEHIFSRIIYKFYGLSTNMISIKTTNHNYTLNKTRKNEVTSRYICFDTDINPTQRIVVSLTPSTSSHDHCISDANILEFAAGVVAFPKTLGDKYLLLEFLKRIVTHNVNDNTSIYLKTKKNDATTKKIVTVASMHTNIFLG